jgi:hypothetical protein
MARDPRRLRSLVFILAGLLALLAAVLPLAKGERINVAFLAVGAVFIILSAIRLRKTPEDREPPVP